MGRLELGLICSIVEKKLKAAHKIVLEREFRSGNARSALRRKS